ncbi:cyclase/dehydrase [Mycobacterium tuberculosis]|nr:cyclase/dehydrase [Mycobacterium tuberculosis]
MVYDAKETFRQRGQHIEYRVHPEGLDKSRVHFDVTVEPAGPVPAFIVKRATKMVLDAATEGLRAWVANNALAGHGED